jgi:hypothetical protein
LRGAGHERVAVLATGNIGPHGERALTECVHPRGSFFRLLPGAVVAQGDIDPTTCQLFSDNGADPFGSGDERDTTLDIHLLRVANLRNLQRLSRPVSVHDYESLELEGPGGPQVARIVLTTEFRPKKAAINRR